jgi:tripartite-type tricarboxylate transporter receptor subunit TctC
MNFPRTGTLLRSASVVLVATAFACGALAQQRFPERPVRLIVPYAPGGGTDILARVLAPKMTESLGQTLVVENRPGAGGNIGADLVAKAPPDGYTLVMGANTIAINAGLGKLPFDPIKDFAPVTLLASAPMLLVVHPSVNARSLQDLLRLAKTNPASLNFSTAGNGTPQHLAAELLNRMAGVNIQHILYKGGGPALTDLVAGQTQVAVLTMGSAKPYVEQGKLRALAVATAKRSKAMSDVPTIAEAGVPGYEADLWYGVFAPAGTPHEIIMRLNADLAKALATPEVQQRLAAQGFEIAPSTPERLGEIHRDDITKYGRLVREAGIKAEQ